MRDHNRIPYIAKLLRQAWKLEPDQRLGQFISNLLGPGRHDIFPIEDIEWVKLLEEKLEKTND